jgi:hypothetical protein
VSAPPVAAGLLAKAKAKSPTPIVIFASDLASTMNIHLTGPAMGQGVAWDGMMACVAIAMELGDSIA